MAPSLSPLGVKNDDWTCEAWPQDMSSHATALFYPTHTQIPANHQHALVCYDATSIGHQSSGLHPWLVFPSAKLQVSAVSPRTRRHQEAERYFACSLLYSKPGTAHYTLVSGVDLAQGH
ncbi:hypothetical protein GOODEAATRI_000984 [Goodea atripinnis]|uniref:Uncharacterized protein n=1 Tax=Goodea atripinnis TaxID=208336 RepID=A0ABV0P3Z6_9TELE